MRKFVIGAVVLVASLAVAAVAFGVTQRTFKQTFAAGPKAKPTTKPGKPTGSYFIETAQDPDNPQNQQPKQDKSVDDFFPVGAVINQAVPGNCTASDNDFSQKGDNACPKSSRIGSGNATLKTNNSSNPDIHATITAYNNRSKKQLVFYINPSPAQPIVLRGTVKGKTGKQHLHVPIPINCVLGTPPNCGPLGDARITEFDLTIDKIVGKKGKNKGKGFVTTPRKCPKSGKWDFKIEFHGRDGKTDTLHSYPPCKK